MPGLSLDGMKNPGGLIHAFHLAARAITEEPEMSKVMDEISA